MSHNAPSAWRPRNRQVETWAAADDHDQRRLFCALVYFHDDHESTFRPADDPGYDSNVNGNV